MSRYDEMLMLFGGWCAIHHDSIIANNQTVVDTFKDFLKYQYLAIYSQMAPHQFDSFPTALIAAKVLLA